MSESTSAWPGRCRAAPKLEQPWRLARRALRPRAVGRLRSRGSRGAVGPGGACVCGRVPGSR
eukprot:15435188-Alexandrium_andersonii.AAC.1